MFRKLLVTSLLVAVCLGVASPGKSYAVLEGAKTAACQGVQLSTSGDCPTDSGSRVNSVVRTIINLLSVAVGIAAVIMIIIGGLKYITSSGDSANISSAKNTIVYAIVGLIVVALAQVIVRFVLTKATTPTCTAPLTLQSDGKCG